MIRSKVWAGPAVSMEHLVCGFRASVSKKSEPSARSGCTHHVPRASDIAGALSAPRQRRLGAASSPPHHDRTVRASALASPNPGSSGSTHRQSSPRRSPVNGSSASSRQPSRSTQSASDATAAEAAIPSEVSSMQPRKQRNPSCARVRACAARARRHRTSPASRSRRRRRRRAGRGLRSYRALVGNNRQRRALLQPAQLVESVRGERLSISTTPSSTSSGTSRAASSGCQPVLASTRIGPPNTDRTALIVSRSCALPTFTFNAGKCAAADARSATTAGSSIPTVKSVGGSPQTSRAVRTTAHRAVSRRGRARQCRSHTSPLRYDLARARTHPRRGRVTREHARDQLRRSQCNRAHPARAGRRQPSSRGVSP